MNIFHEALSFLNPCLVFTPNSFWGVALGSAQSRKALTTKDPRLPPELFLATTFPILPTCQLLTVFYNKVAFTKKNLTERSYNS